MSRTCDAGSFACVAHAHRVVEAGGEALRPVAADLVRIDVVHREAAQRADEAHQRRDDLQRVAVVLHDARVGVDGEQRFERPQVAAATSAPSARRAPSTAASGASACGSRRRGAGRRARASSGSSARGCWCARSSTGELVLGDRDAFLRQLRAHRVHRLEVGQQAVDAGEVRVDLRDARIARRRCAASGGGNGCITSHVIGTRFGGSCAISSCRIEVPVRGRPRMKSGRSMRSAVDLAVLLAQTRPGAAGSRAGARDRGARSRGRAA